MLNISKIGPLLSFIGIFGGGLFWIVACTNRMRDPYIGYLWYGVENQSIWIRDPTFAVLAALPAIILFSLGFFIAVSPILRNQDRDTHSDMAHQNSRKRVRLNLFFIGEIFILSTTTLGLGAFFEGFASTIEIVVLPTIIFAFLSLICIFNLLSMCFYVLEGDIENIKAIWTIRGTILSLTIGLMFLVFAVLALQLYTLIFIREVAIFLLLSGCFGILFLFPSATTKENEDGAEGEI